MTLKKKELKKLFPDWASPEAVIERIGKEYSDSITESDIFRNSAGEVLVTMDFEHILILPDEERPGLYIVCRTRIFENSTTYSDANRGLAGFQS